MTQEDMLEAPALLGKYERLLHHDFSSSLAYSFCQEHPDIIFLTFADHIGVRKSNYTCE
jgi:hypothetical protein